MLEARKPVSPDAIALQDTFHERRTGVRAARATAAWLVTGAGADDRSPLLPHDLGLLRATLWQCATLPPRVRVRDMLLGVATLVNVHLPTAEAGQVWAAVRAAPCWVTLGAEDRAWLELFAAVGARDAAAMARLGEPLVRGEAQVKPELRAYALLAATTGLTVQRQRDRARALVSAHVGTLPPAQRNDAAFLVLRGAAPRTTAPGDRS